MENQKYITERLFSLQDVNYRDFHAKLIPTVPPEKIIGVRSPQVRALAKELSKTEYAEPFLKNLPHCYYDENNLHAFLIEQIKDCDKCIAEIERFLPYVDNWATCDSMNPKVLGKNKEKLLEKIKQWMCSSETYTVRFGVEMLMRHFLDADFNSEYCEMVAAVKSDEYYINMILAWYFATALAKQWDVAVSYITDLRLSPWVHNKTIQKAVESYRITDSRKDLLRSLRIKNKVAKK